MAEDVLIPLHQQIDRVFADFFGSDVPPFPGAQWDRGFRPSMDVSETDQQFEIAAELPGLRGRRSSRATASAFSF